MVRYVRFANIDMFQYDSEASCKVFIMKISFDSYEN